jgi:choice-of-anchor A domain-containing protein
MTGLTKICFGSFRLGAVAIAAAISLPSGQAQAGFLFAIGPPVCTCGDLTFTSSNVVGNVEIGDGGAFIGSTANGPGNITGTVEFAAPNTGQYRPDGITVAGGATFGNANIQAEIASYNAASQMFSTEAGTPLTLTAGGYINASRGMLDSGGNEVFTATLGRNFVAGTTFTINGTSDQFVVVNIPSTGGLPFDGSIVLTGGITADQVLFNFDSGDYLTNTGGDTLTIENGLPTVYPATTGVYLDPNGAIDIIDSVIDGRVLGGPTDFQITDSTIIAPVPEPASLALFGAGLIVFGIIRWRSRVLPARS